MDSLVFVILGLIIIVTYLALCLSDDRRRRVTIGVFLALLATVVLGVMFLEYGDKESAASDAFSYCEAADKCLALYDLDARYRSATPSERPKLAPQLYRQAQDVIGLDWWWRHRLSVVSNDTSRWLDGKEGRQFQDMLMASIHQAKRTTARLIEAENDEGRAWEMLGESAMWITGDTDDDGGLYAVTAGRNFGFQSDPNYKKVDVPKGMRAQVTAFALARWYYVENDYPRSLAKFRAGLGENWVQTGKLPPWWQENLPFTSNDHTCIGYLWHLSGRDDLALREYRLAGYKDASGSDMEMYYLAAPVMRRGE